VTAPAFPLIGVHSGQAMTVTGPVPVDELGATLTHEHVLCDFGANGSEPEEASRRHLFHRPLTIDVLGAVRSLPMANRDNQRLTDVDVAVAEVERFAHAGGRTIVELTLDGAGRDPLGLAQVSRRSGVQVVMGAGFYIEAAHPARVAGMSADDIADEIVRDLVDGVRDTGVRAGIIGEVGIDLDFSAAEERSLRGACRASARTQVPLVAHTPGGSSRSHDYRRRLLDIVEEEGADIRHTVVAHVTIDPRDLDAQMETAARGAFLGYDGISCGFDWGARGIGPCDRELAEDIRRLVDAGFVDHILLSQDVHMKIMLTRWGGLGYAHVLDGFGKRLLAAGVPAGQARTMLEDNPRRLFSARHRGEG
jgi:phosphotriesterase-related protein